MSLARRHVPNLLDESSASKHPASSTASDVFENAISVLDLANTLIPLAQAPFVAPVFGTLKTIVEIANVSGIHRSRCIEMQSDRKALLSKFVKTRKVAKH